MLLQKTKASDVPEQLHACSIYEVTVENMECALLAAIARDGQITLRDALRASITALRSPLADFYQAALIAADMDAHEMSVISLAGNTTTVLVYRFKAYTLRLARDLGEMVIARHDERAFANRPAVKYTRVNNPSFSPCAVSVPLAQLPASTSLPHLHATLSTSLPPPDLSFATLGRAHFSSSSKAGGPLQASPSSFGGSSQLSPFADVAVLSRARSRSQSQLHSQSSGFSSSATVRANDPASQSVLTSPSAEPASQSNAQSASQPSTQPAPVPSTQIAPVTSAASTPADCAVEVDRATVVCPPPQPARHPLSLPRDEYEALTAHVLPTNDDSSSNKQVIVV